MNRSKKHQDAVKLIEKEAYKLDEAIDLLKKTSVTKFDSSCEVHLRLGVDPRQADQNIRTTVVLPHGTGKDVRVVAFVDDRNAAAAKNAGAILAGTEELIKKIEDGWTEFDIAVATPDQMKNLGKVAKTLGQKRLMPSPKAGTVTPDFENAISELKKGRVELRVDKFGIIHNVFGKVSFSSDNLKENLLAVFRSILDVKPSSSKGNYVRSFTVTTTMGPGIRIDLSDAMEAVR